MVWKYEKFKGDMAIYAFCQKCNFHHNPSSLVTDEAGKRQSVINYQYRYCPICGEYLFDDNAETAGYEVTWNEREIFALYNI